MRCTISRNNTGAMNEVPIAITTMIANIAGVRMPSVTPISATTRPIAPRAFIATPIAADSQKVMPPMSPPHMQPISFPAVATPNTTNSMRGDDSVCRSTLSPTMPKNTGANTESDTDSSRCNVAARMPGTCRKMQPAMNAPNTACTPIFSVTAESVNASTTIAARSVLGVRERSSMTWNSQRANGTSTKPQAARNTPVSASVFMKSRNK